MAWLITAIPAQIAIDEIVVRRYTRDDAAALVDAVTASLPELLPWMPWAKFEPQTVAQRRELIEVWSREWDQGLNYTMGIFIGSECVGGTGFHLRGDVGVLEIGYWVSTVHSGRGIITRVSEALTTSAFMAPEVHEVQILHDVANVRSQRIPERLGFTMTGESDRNAEAPAEAGRLRRWVMTREQWALR